MAASRDRARADMRQWHMDPAASSLRYEVVRMQSNSHPSQPLAWLRRHDDRPSITTRFRMRWRISVFVDIVARHRRDVQFGVTVAVALEIEDLMPDQEQHLDEFGVD